MPDDGPQGSGYRLYTRWHVVAAALGGLAVLGGTFAIVGVERYERAVATVQLARMGGRRLVLDADIDRRVMPSEEAALVERSATVLRRRIEKLTGKRVLSTVEGRKVILDLPLPTVEQWGRLEAARHGEKLLPLLLQQAKLEFKPVDDEQKPLAAIRELPAYISLDWDRYEGPGGRIVSHHQQPFPLSRTWPTDSERGRAGGDAGRVLQLGHGRSARLVESRRSQQTHHYFLSRSESLASRVAGACRRSEPPGVWRAAV